MKPWQDAVLAFSADPGLAALLVAAEPAWIWSRDGASVLWANPAGGRLLVAGAFGALARRRWLAGHVLRRDIQNLDRSMPVKGTLARLRLSDDPRAVPIACRCRFVQAGADSGILAVALASLGTRPSMAELTAFFSDEEGASDTISGPEASEGPPATAVAEPAGESRGASGALALHSTVPPVASFAQSSEQAAPTPAANDSIEMLPAGASLATDAGREADPPVDQPAQSTRSITAGRVPRELSRKPVRFLWQTDAADRMLFVSPGLSQVVGRNAEIVGERWQDAAERLRLDPAQRIARAVAQRDTWSGLTAWWPVEGSNVRVPAELTALPVFGSDHSFQGYRGFGVLRPAEALMPAAFETRFAAGQPPPEQLPSYEESAAPPAANVVPIRADLERLTEHARLTSQERTAFEEIAAALRRRVVEALEAEAPGAGGFPAAERGMQPAAPEEPLASSTAAEPTELAAIVPAEPAPVMDATEPARPVAPAAHSEASGAKDRENVAESAPPLAETAPAPRHRPAVPESEAQSRLRELTAILDTATDGVIILDADGVIESANASAEALFGRDANEFQGLNFGELLTPESRAAARDYLSGLRDNGVASLLNEGREIEARAGAGVIPLFMTMGRISSQEGGRFCAVLRDITHWKRTEAELVAARSAAETASGQKSEFLARVSHEIRTPLNAIIGFAEVMIEERFGPVENERYRDYLRDIRTSGEHVVSLVNDLLDISKIEAGKLDLSFVAVPLNDLVRECIGLMQPQAGRAHVVLRSSLSREVPAIVADQRTLRQIVLNLLSNAVKFTGPGGQIIASTSLAESGEALLRIRDTGEGMSEAELARALEPFRQIATAPLADRTGTGLGLPLTKALVEANRAHLAIRSARGEGTVVTITFPATRVLSE